MIVAVVAVTVFLCYLAPPLTVLAWCLAVFVVWKAHRDLVVGPRTRYERELDRRLKFIVRPAKVAELKAANDERERREAEVRKEAEEARLEAEVDRAQEADWAAWNRRFADEMSKREVQF